MSEQPVVRWAPLRAAVIPLILILVVGYVGVTLMTTDATEVLVKAGGSLLITLGAYLLAANLIPKAIAALPGSNFVWQSRIAWATFSISLVVTTLLLILALL